MAPFTYEIKINKERIAVLIGTNGKTKKRLEKLTSSKIHVDSEEGEVIIEGEDSPTLFNLLRVIQAIGRGFNPDIAQALLSVDYALEVIGIQDFVGKEKNKQQRVKSRLIGTKGKSRRMLEQLTNTEIEIYGKTVSIIGKIEDVVIAKQAVEALIKGSKHGNVYALINRRKKEVTTL